MSTCSDPARRARTCIDFVLTDAVVYGEPPGPLHRATDEAYAPGIENSARINATLLALVRNEELDGMIQAMRDLERTWNHKFNYPWTFFNEVPFSEEFKRRTSAATKAETRYGKETPGRELLPDGLIPGRVDMG